MATSNSMLISNLPELRGFLFTISASNMLYLDLDGKSLSRNGTLCIVSILVYPEMVVCLVDVAVLGR